MKKLQAAMVGGALAVATFWAEAAAACPACVDPKAQTSTAMLISTIFMSIVPLTFLGSVAFWVWKKTKAAEEALDEAGDDVTHRD